MVTYSPRLAPTAAGVTADTPPPLLLSEDPLSLAANARATASKARVLFGYPRLLAHDFLLPSVLNETRYIEALQRRFRTPARDTFFQAASIFGGHNFYVMFLPILVWLGLGRFARTLTMLMCVDIYVCNFIKDILCLPRPISPPVVRLDSGQGYSREYGFPSAHSINALNMPLYAVLYWVAHASLSIDGSGEYSLSAGVDSLGWLPVGLATLASLTFTLTIGASRIYTGMHSLTDVAGGLILGMVISYFWQFAYPAVDAFVFSAAGPAVFLLVAIALAGMHPNPIDPTPSFADTVSFLFTVVGVNAGSHMYHNLAQVPGSVLAGERDVLLSFLAHRHSSHPLSWMASALAGMWPGTVPFSMEYHGLMKALLRVIYGLAVVFISRALAREGSKILLRLVYRSLGLPDDSRQTDTSQDKGKVPSVVRATAAAGSVSFYKISRLGVDSVSRAFAYTVMGWFITCFIPASFPYIGL